MNINDFGQPLFECGLCEHDCDCLILDPSTLRLKQGSRFSNEIGFHCLLTLQGQIKLDEDQFDLGLSLLEQAYEVARDSKSLDPDNCFEAISHFESRGFYTKALELYWDLYRKVLKNAHIDYLARLYHLLEDFGIPGSQTNSDALILREEVSEKYPGVMLTKRAIRIL